MPKASNLKVLIVDDQHSMRLLIRGGLQQLGFRTFEEAGDGEAGLRSLAGCPMDLVISDYNMPKMDGLEFLRAVRAYPPIAKTAYIMLTGRGDMELVQRAVQLGVNNFLVKPFTVDTLRGKIEAIFGALT